ncbi:hypothetical protein GTY81_23290 [Streptomyces sp. SID8366]|nr:hypothetical protein [Streptomyces sp. SID8366]MYU61278.1 hypothetical protein [Streptomyces sp. SID69]RAJ54108.1 hypothetical protein K376_05424 [Streptomyces sp. PsTaAH-130]
MHESVPGGRANGLIEDEESIIPGRRIGQQGDADEVQGLGEVAGTTAGKGEFLVGHRPVIGFGQVLEVDRSL